MTLYNEIDKGASAWLRNLMGAGQISRGVVDERSIKDLGADDLAGATRVHLFAGIGGWDLALRIAGWPEDWPAWTGSCPCQPFSGAGKRQGVEDPRHLWPDMFRLVHGARPPVVFGEQVSSPAGRAWCAGVRADLEGAGYHFDALAMCAAGVGAPHIRERIYWGALRLPDADRQRRDRIDALLRAKQGWSGAAQVSETARGGEAGGLGAAGRSGIKWNTRAGSRPQAPSSGGWSGNRTERDAPVTPGADAFWGDFDVLPFRDGKVRRAEPIYVKMVDGLSGGMGYNGGGSASIPEAEDEEEVRPDAPASHSRRSRAVSMVQPTNGEEEVWVRHLGGQRRVHAQAVLQPRLHGTCDGRHEGRDGAQWTAAGCEDCEAVVRVLRTFDDAAERASYRREPDQQRPIEFEDIVRLLPSSYALAELRRDGRTARALLDLWRAILQESDVLPPLSTTEAAWRSVDGRTQSQISQRYDLQAWEIVKPYPLSTNAEARTMRLRGYGNAIVPQLAAVFVQAFMETVARW